jgi:hypothetical protein
MEGAFSQDPIIFWSPYSKSSDPTTVGPVSALIATRAQSRWADFDMLGFDRDAVFLSAKHVPFPPEVRPKHKQQRLLSAEGRPVGIGADNRPQDHVGKHFHGHNGSICRTIVNLDNTGLPETLISGGFGTISLRVRPSSGVSIRRRSSA